MAYVEKSAVHKLRKKQQKHPVYEDKFQAR